MEDLLDLRGRVAMVTGAGRGVGRQVAIDLARHNAGTVVVNDFYPDRAEQTAAAVEAAGAKALALQFDVSDFAAVTAAVRQAEDLVGGIEILVNNAGNAGPATNISDPRQFWETGPADWDHWLSANFFGVMNCSHAVVGGMTSRGYGRVVTVISDAGRIGEPNLVVYSGAKAGAAGFMRALAKAVGRFGITANCVALSAMRTPATDSLTEDPDVVKRMLKNYVIRRLGEPADASAAVLFLASDAAGWITGQTYPVNGGYAISA